MIRNAPLFRTAVLLFWLAASIAPSTARASHQNSAAEQAAAAQAAAEAAAAFEACEARFDAALASRDVAAADAALRDLFAARTRLDAAKPDAGAVSRYRSRYDALQSFKNNTDFARKSLEAALSGAEADAAEGTWPSVQSALRRIDAALSDAQTLLKKDELASAAARATKLRDSLRAWQASQASREREVAEAAAIRGEIARADRLLARVAAEQDFDAADRRISEATTAIDGAEARATALATVPVADLQSSIAELRADAGRARDAVAANRATAGIRARVAKIVREVNALAAGPESQPDMARLDADCDRVRKDLEADRRVPAAAATELSDLLRTSRERIARVRGALDAETAKRRVADALSAAEQSVGEAGELIRAGQFDDADGAIKAAGDSMSQMAEALKAVPDAAWRNEMGRRGSLLQARLERTSKAVAAARASAALEAELLAADANIKSMSSKSWDQDRARIIELSQSPDLPPAMRTRADAMVAELDSAIAYSKATETLTGPIKEHIDSGDFDKALKELEKLRKDLKGTTLSADHQSSLGRETAVLEARIKSERARLESEEFWYKVAFAGSAVGVLLLVLIGWAMLRRRNDGMAADLRAARQSRDQKVRQLRSDRDRLTASDAVRSDAIERLANFDRIETAGFTPIVPGAADAPLEWQDTFLLASQLAVIGQADAARALLAASARHKLVPGTPILKRLLRRGGWEKDWFAPYFESMQVRQANGARAVEAAHAWTEVWRASSPAVRDLVAREADHWFKVAVDWLPGHEDVPALYAQAEFKRDQGNADEALKLLVGTGNTAEQRIKAFAKTIPASVQCRVFLLAANIKLDVAGVVTLQASGAVRAPSWPVVDQYAANLQSGPSSAGPTGAPSSGALIADARELLRRAEQALSTAAPVQGFPQGAAAREVFGQGSTAGASPVPGSTGSEESLRFQIDAAHFRAELGGGHRQAENALQRVLQEGEPLAAGVIISLSAQSPHDARLSDGWSSLQLRMDRGELSADDCRVVRDMRLNWVNWCIDRGIAFGSIDRETRMRFFRKAAWLTCRYWLFAAKQVPTEQWVIRSALARMASTVLAVEDRIGVFGGTQRSKTLGDAGWNPIRDQGSAEDRAIFAILVEIVGAESGDVGGKDSTGTPTGPGGSGGGPGNDVPPPPAPKPTLSNVWLVPGTQQQPERVEGKDIPVFGSLRIVDPTMSAADVEGAYAWIDIGGGDAARAMGVFGFELTGIYMEPLRVVQKAVKELDASGSPIIGFVNQLADLTFDGLAKLASGFKVVLSRPKSPSVYEPMGGDSARLLRGDLLCSPIALDRDRIFAPTPARQPPAPVSEELIERSLLEISMFIAAVGLDAKPIPQVVGAVSGQYGLTDSASAEAWLGMVRFFREQLGRGLVEVRDEIVSRSQKAAGSGLVAAQAPFADSILDEQFIRLLVQQFCCRADELRYVDAAGAWQRMDPSLKSAMERLVRRFDERTPNILNKESLKKHFGIDLGGPPSPAAVGASVGGAAGPLRPDERKPAGPDPNPLRAEFEGIVRDLPHREVGDFWPFATSREALLGTLQDMSDNLQGLSLVVSPERRAGIGALIDRIRAIQGKLR
jgi:hypothetical protein